MKGWPFLNEKLLLNISNQSPSDSAQIEKNEFFAYIGDEKDLSGYQKSYKLVFYKCFFELMKDSVSVPAKQLVNQFQQFYINRKQIGLVPDHKVDAVIENIERSSLASIYSLILRNPFNAISSRGYIDKFTRDGEDYFTLSHTLHQALTEFDKKNIIELVSKKIQYYFSRIDRLEGQTDHLLLIFNRIFLEYSDARRETFRSHPLGQFFRREIPEYIYETRIVNRETHLVAASVGQGTWATIPWICIFDRSITDSSQRGVYIVYLLSEDGNTLYLALNQGCTDLRRTNSREKTIQLVQSAAEKIRSEVNSRGFAADNGVFLGQNLPEMAELYSKSTIFYKAYHKGEVPPENVLREDLKNMLAVYADYAATLTDASPGAEVDPADAALEEQGGTPPMSTLDTLAHIKAFIAARGFSYNDGLVENFYLSIKSKPFTLLAGTSGTGKTRLVKLFAEAVGATVNNGRYKLVAVRPDWSDSSDLFGHVDLNGRFIPGAIIDFVHQASLDLNAPYFLCLDEMNLARVEYYLSDVLSIIETREFQDDRIVSHPLLEKTYFGADEVAAERYDSLHLPENLYIVGTVNMDETTFPFSRKVLDRANTIEFSYVDLMPQDSVDRFAVPALDLPNHFLRAEYLLLTHCGDDSDAVERYCAKLQDINEVLAKANAHVGYRVRDEIVFYMLNNQKAELLSEDEAMDNQIMQKILPRIQGSSASIKAVLVELFKLCMGNFQGLQTMDANLSDVMQQAANSSQCKYAKSAQKIAFMVRRYEEDGFTSYWL